MGRKRKYVTKKQKKEAQRFASKKYYHNNKIKRFYVYIYLDPRKFGKYIYDDLKFNYEPFYIGKGCRTRINHHINDVKNNNLKALKYNSFKFNKIKNILNIGMEPIKIKFKDNMSNKQALKLETKLIKKIGRYNMKTGPLTNLTDDAGSGGLIWPEKIIKRRRKEIYQFDLEGNFIREWESIKSAAIINNIDKGTIQAVCSGKQFSSGRFTPKKRYVWKYKKDCKNLSLEDMKNEILLKKIIFKKEKYKNVKRQIYQFDLEGNFIKKWDSTRDIERELGIYCTVISTICRKRKRYDSRKDGYKYKGNTQKTADGFVWRYKEDCKDLSLIKKEIKELDLKGINKRNKNIDIKYHPIQNRKKGIIQKDFDGNEIRRWESIIQIEKTLGFLSSSISSVCNGNRKTSYNFKWEFYIK